MVPRHVWSIALALIAPLVLAQWSDKSTGFNLTRLPSFPLTKVSTGQPREGEPLLFDEIVATTHDAEVVVRGKGKLGKRWMVHFANVAFDQVFRADLDHNGTQDYIIFGGRPNANGRTAPDDQLTVLLMDQQGLPVPFEVPLYLHGSDEGPKRLVDLRHDGRAELLVSTYDEGAWDARVEGSCSGHWITQLYEIEDLNWVEVRGTLADIHFPFVHRWTDYGKCSTVETPRRIHDRISLPQLSTAPSEIKATRIRHVRDNGLVEANLDYSPGCSKFEIGTVVYDRPEVRDIALFNLGSDHQKQLLIQMRREAAQVRLQGVDRDPEDHECSANLLWGSKLAR